jgi:hypothetical protein
MAKDQLYLLMKSEFLGRINRAIDIAEQDRPGLAYREVMTAGYLLSGMEMLRSLGEVEKEDA